MADSNRIGEVCWFRLADGKPGTEVGKWRRGRLYEWSTDFEELYPNVALFPVGVVEDTETGLCHSIYVTRICFASIPPA